LSSTSHLERAVWATRLSEAADRLARAEVISAREDDGATWEDVGATFGVSRQTAHERFRTGPDGLHSRLFKAKAAQSVKSNSTAASGGRSTAARGREAQSKPS